MELVSSFTRLNSTALLHTNNNIFSFWIKSNLVKLETSHTVILPPMLIILWTVWRNSAALATLIKFYLLFAIIVLCTLNCQSRWTRRCRSRRRPTFDWYDELGHDGQDLLWSALREEVLDAADRDEDVWVFDLTEAVEEEGKIVVVVEAVDGDLETMIDTSWSSFV